MLSEIENKIEATKKALRSISYVIEEVSAQEFYDYMTGEIFSGRCLRQRVSYGS